MRHEQITTEYLCYLMNRAQIEAEGSYGYLKLCEILQDVSFLPILVMDENRCGECRNLRKDFADGYDEADEMIKVLDWSLSESGTILELMIVLSERMNYELSESQYEYGTGKWFKEMLANCGLIMACNERFEENANQEDEVRDILDEVNFRKFGWDGEGGFYPLRCPHRDQRYAELIMQMNDYIEENYDIC